MDVGSLAGSYQLFHRRLAKGMFYHALCSFLRLPLCSGPLLYLGIRISPDATAMLPRLLLIRISDVATFALLMDLDRKQSAEALNSQQP